METPSYIRINDYDIIDENGNVIASGLTMDEQATIEDDAIAYEMTNGPGMRPKKPR